MTIQTHLSISLCLTLRQSERTVEKTELTAVTKYFHLKSLIPTEIKAS